LQGLPEAESHGMENMELFRFEAQVIGAGITHKSAWRIYV
jgi:hypothetical protein